MRIAALCLACGLLLLGCRDPRTQHIVGKVLVDSAVGGEGAPLDRQMVRAAVSGGVVGLRHLRVEQGGPARLRARGAVGRSPASVGGMPVVVVTIALAPGGTGRGGMTIEATAEHRGEGVADPIEPLLERAARAALESVDRQVALGDRDTTSVARALGSEDRELRARAVSILADRRDPEAFPHLVKALEDDDQAIALRAVGAIVALGDPRGVPVLTDLTHRKPPSFVRQIVYAVGAIGGREAEAYLFTVASGHADAAVRAAAEEALGELRAKTEERPRGSKEES